MISLRAPEFWWRKAGAAAAMLYPAGVIYGAIAARRMKRPGYRASIPVICIGNPTLGGAGKTPTAIAIAALLKRDGKNAFFLTRGYGGSEAGPLLADLAKHDANAIGDEAPLLAAAAPTVVARDRAAGARLAESSGADVIVMDDGFQNPSLSKDFSLLVIDGARGIGNGLVFPAGPLRAPFEQQFERAQATLIMGDGEAGENAARLATAAGLRVFSAQLAPDPDSIAALQGQRVLAFAGIGAPEKFFRSLEAAGAIVAAKRSFGDHHRYTAGEAAELLGQAARSALQLVTTEKDLARMRGDAALAALRTQAKILRVHATFDDESSLLDSIRKTLQR